MFLKLVCAAHCKWFNDGDDDDDETKHLIFTILKILKFCINKLY